MSAVAPVKIEYTPKEFAQFVTISAESLRKPKYYRRYGGKKRGGRIVFSEAARQAILKGNA